MAPARLAGAGLLQLSNSCLLPGKGCPLLGKGSLDSSECCQHVGGGSCSNGCRGQCRCGCKMPERLLRYLRLIVGVMLLRLHCWGALWGHDHPTLHGGARCSGCWGSVLLCTAQESHGAAQRWQGIERECSQQGAYTANQVIREEEPVHHAHGGRPAKDLIGPCLGLAPEEVCGILKRGSCTPCRQINARWMDAVLCTGP